MKEYHIQEILGDEDLDPYIRPIDTALEAGSVGPA